MGVECWLCTGRGQGQVRLRPDGAADGRRLCRVCARRMLDWLRDVPAAERAAALAAVWPSTTAAPMAEVDADVTATRAAFLESVSAALPGMDDAARLAASIGYLEMGLWGPALQILPLVDPLFVEGAGDRVLTTLFSRLLHQSALGPGARELLERALYPGLRPS
ncbi:MAG: hypothetical protein HY901_17335 [Deltaproteobacteria bacterium]|nr:hypothetical protein [Deltaproteobacteria bacterium]